MAECKDRNCPIHGGLKVRGSVTEGTVVSAKAKKTAIIEKPMKKYIPKFQRYARSKSKIAAHNPDCIKAKEGDEVKIAETRKLSKTKSWVIIEVKKKAGE